MRRTKVKCRFFLDDMTGKGPVVLELFSSENEALLIRGDSLLVLDLGLHVIDGVGRLDLKSNGLASKSFHKDLHSYRTGQILFSRKSGEERQSELTGMLKWGR
jgi:hypothetical protein